LEQLSDHAREANHPQRKKFDAIFKQCRPLANSNSLAEVVLQLLGDKEERDVASQIRKIFKGHPSPRSSAPGQAFEFWEDNSVVPRPGPYPGVHLVAVDVSGHSSTDRGPFLDAVLTAEELVILLGIAL